MSLPVEFLSGADADLQEIFNRLEDYHSGFGVEFMMTVDAYLTRIAAFPEIAPPYFEKVRRQVMQGFPNGIFLRTSSDAYSGVRNSRFAAEPGKNSSAIGTLRNL